MRTRLFALIALAATALLVAGAAGSTPPGGGPERASNLTAPPPGKTNRSGRLVGWLDGFTTTEYHPTPERWFGGPKRTFPGLEGSHRVAWLLSANGIAMAGHGWGETPTGPGTRVASYISGSAGWVNERGRPTRPGSGASGWSAGPPAWLACGWKNRRGGWTFPANYLSRGEPVRWANGRPHRWVGCNVRFSAGLARPLRFWNSVAVDPNLFPLGRTWFYIPAYRNTRCAGWFRADDIGGAIRGRHIDVFRPAPTSPSLLRTRYNQRVYVARGTKPAGNPCA